MNKLSKLKEQYAKLGEEIESLEKENEFEPGWYAYWDNNDTSKAIEYFIDFIRTNESLNERISRWDNVVKINKDAFDKLLKPKTIYDWSKIPEWATITIINKDGDVCCGDFTGCSIILEEGAWEGNGAVNYGWQRLHETFVLNPPDDWKNSLERRPK